MVSFKFDHEAPPWKKQIKFGPILTQNFFFPLQMTVEKVQGISRLEQLCEEFSEEERVRELKQEKKRQKRKNRRKNKCVCDIPAPLQTADEKEVSQEKVVFLNTDLWMCHFRWK